MKDRFLFFVLLSSFICLFSVESNSHLEFIRKFKVDEIRHKKHVSNHIISASDSLIYILDNTIENNTKVYTYNFFGKENQNFSLPSDSLYNRVTDFSFLLDNKCLAITDADNGIDFYDLQGKIIKRLLPERDYEFIFLTAEYNKNLYFYGFNYFDHDSTITGRIYQKQRDNSMVEIERIHYDREDVAHNKNETVLMNSNDNGLIYAILKNNNYHITLFQHLKTKVFSIKKEKNVKLLDIHLFKNYCLVNTIKQGFFPHYSKTFLYSLEGQRLEYLKDLYKNSDSITVIDDYLISLNVKNKEISIYKIKDF